MDADLAAIVREMKDRQQIYDCLMRYCRGIDRLDRAVLESAYHPDAAEDHGYVVGPANKFIDWALAFHAEHIHRSHHHITNHQCEIDGDTAHAESSFIARYVSKQAPYYSTSTGRYLDRFEKRNGEWRIAAQICMVDTRDENIAPTGTEGDSDGFYRTTTRDRSDPSYERPINVDPARYTG